MDQMKKVMGAEANYTEANDKSGGKVMKLGGYSTSEKSGEAKKLSANKSGFSGASTPEQKYQ